MKSKDDDNKQDSWDCRFFPCGDSCCQHGVDVFSQERDLLIVAGLALASDFSGPETDEDGTSLYRTKKDKRGCVFLQTPRGCRLHSTGYKPSVCRAWPRTLDEARQAARQKYLPCFATRWGKRTAEVLKTNSADV